MPLPVTLHDLQSFDTYKRATVSVKVKKIAERDTGRTGKRKQDFIIAANSASAKVNLWE